MISPLRSQTQETPFYFACRRYPRLAPHGASSKSQRHSLEGPFSKGSDLGYSISATASEASGGRLQGAGGAEEGSVSKQDRHGTVVAWALSVGAPAGCQQPTDCCMPRLTLWNQDKRARNDVSLRAGALLT